jgi:hypothetical protein
MDILWSISNLTFAAAIGIASGGPSITCPQISFCNSAYRTCCNAKASTHSQMDLPAECFHSLHIPQHYDEICQLPTCLQDPEGCTYPSPHSPPWSPYQVSYKIIISSEKCLHENTMYITVMSVPVKNKYNKNVYSYSIVTVTHKVLDPHLHCEWQWLAAITPLTSTGPDNGCRSVYNSLLKILVNNSKKICS